MPACVNNLLEKNGPFCKAFQFGSEVVTVSVISAARKEMLLFWQ